MAAWKVRMSPGVEAIGEYVCTVEYECLLLEAMLEC